MTLRQTSVLPPSIKTDGRRFLFWPEREIPTGNGADWQQLLELNIRAKVHVMVAIDAPRRCAIKPLELIELSANRIFEVPGQAGMKKGRREAIRTKKASDLSLVLD
jgi:hypothetical protein